MSSGERSVQSDFYETIFAALGVQIVNGLFDGVTDRTHGNDHMLCISSAVVVEQFVVSANFLVDFVHILFYNFGNRCV